MLPRAVTTRNLRHRDVLLKNPFNTSSVIIRRDLPLRFSEQLQRTEDYLLWCEVIMAGYRSVALDPPLAFVFAILRICWFVGEFARYAEGEITVYDRLYETRQISRTTCFGLKAWSYIRYWRRLRLAASGHHQSNERSLPSAIFTVCRICLPGIGCGPHRPLMSPDSWVLYDISRWLWHSETVTGIRQYRVATDLPISHPFFYPALIGGLDQVLGTGFRSGLIINALAILALPWFIYLAIEPIAESKKNAVVITGWLLPDSALIGFSLRKSSPDARYRLPPVSWRWHCVFLPRRTTTSFDLRSKIGLGAGRPRFDAF